MQHSRFRTLAAVAALGLALAPAAQAGFVVWENEEKGQEVEIGGRFQIQYLMEDPSDGDSSDELFFRRVRPEILAKFNENWSSKFQLDVGKAEDGNEVAIKDAYFKYSGAENVALTFGNQKPPSSRELLTSSKEQQLVERTFIGDHNYGVLDRMLGVKINGEGADGQFQWAVMGGEADHDPDATKLDWDTPVNKNGDFNQGWAIAGGLDFFPMGEFKFSQGDLERGDTKLGIRAHGYTWSNDGDNDTYTEDGVSISESKADVDSATGVGADFALRSHGFSVDAGYMTVDADTVDTAFTGGIYSGGETSLDILAIEGGFAFSEHFEIVAGYDTLDADNYADSWDRTSVGFNTFFEKHKAKLQVTYQMGENVDGVPGVDADLIYVQLQHAF